MKSRAKDKGTPVAQEFERFADFMEHMGEKPSPAHTLDRVDPHNPLYGPENCRWASKEEQANNRRNTIKVMFEGKLTPIAEVARATGQNADTLRRRLSYGWSHEEVVRGREGVAQQMKPPVDLMASFRWIGREAVARTWASLFLYGEQDEFGTHVLTQKVRAIDGTLRDETFAEFVLRIHGWWLDAHEGGDIDRLPRGFEKKFSSMPEEERSADIAKITSQYDLALEKVIDETWSVGPMANGIVCEVPWLGWMKSDKVDRSELLRTVLAFRNCGMRVPGPLMEVYRKNQARMFLPKMPEQ